MTEKAQLHIFKSWLNKYRALVFKVVRAYASSSTDQDDLFQEISIQVWRSIPSFLRESSESTWIYRIALNTAIKWIKKEKKHNYTEGIDKLQPVLQDMNKPPDDRLDWLYEEIHRLNEIDRSVALLMLDDFSYKEMASILGITETNVGVKINRIKKHLISQSKKMNDHGI